jgi:hypothetical protein
MDRRELLKKASAVVGWGAVSAWSPSARAMEVKYPAYENNLRGPSAGILTT